jgi:uroporphyrinogen III methyltransferase/synthase
MAPSRGKIYFVGAGPGDPGLLTLRGAECLAAADVVLYDYLANPRILRHARAGAELLCLGAHGRTKIWAQAEINARLVADGLAGRIVARLKGGDPTIFGRLAEELEVVRAADIPFEIVPGITAASAAASYAGISMTHRDLASAVALVTGHEDPDKSESAIDYDALARFPGTLVFYMGVTNVEVWTRGLLDAGKPAETPVTIVRRASLPDQVVIHTTLGETAAALTPAHKLRPPVIVLVGAVAALGPTMAWFEKRPLFGQKIAITRAAAQSDELRRPLEALGAEVLEQPAIEIADVADFTGLDGAIGKLARYDWIVLSSANGVERLMARLLATGHDLRAFSGAKLAAIGPGTAQKLAEYHLHADVVPDEFRAESLAAALAPQARGKSFLLIRASRGREVLAEELSAGGGQVEQVVVYESRDVMTPEERVAQLLRDGQLDWMTVTSSAIARSLANLFGEDLRRTRLASISPITSATMRELGYPPVVEATDYTMDGVVRAILLSRL